MDKLDRIQFRAYTQIDKNLTVAVVVKRAWANLHGVRMFLREDPQTEICGIDGGHVLVTAKEFSSAMH